MSPFFSPVSAGGVPKATITSTTGSPTVNTNARAGKTIYKFNGSGTITVGTAGTAEALIIGGGGAGYQGAGGAGGFVYLDSMFLPAGTSTITVGAGAATNPSPSPNNYSLATSIGYPSSIGTPNSTSGYTALGGGCGGRTAGNNSDEMQGYAGGSGGGATGYYNFQGNGGEPLLGQGYKGGAGYASYGGYGAGGGAGGAGGDTTFYPNGPAGGIGRESSITGTATYYAGGGGGQSINGNNNTGKPGAGGLGGGGNFNSKAGGANLGGGGYAGGAGGSGVVIVVVG